MFHKPQARACGVFSARRELQRYWVIFRAFVAYQNFGRQSVLCFVCLPFRASITGPIHDNKTRMRLWSHLWHSFIKSERVSWEKVTRSWQDSPKSRKKTVWFLGFDLVLFPFWVLRVIRYFSLHQAVLTWRDAVRRGSIFYFLFTVNRCISLRYFSRFVVITCDHRVLCCHSKHWLHPAGQKLEGWVFRDIRSGDIKIHN
jgi:hypothetical protein